MANKDTTFNNWFVVYFERIGSRVTGSYLVKADNKSKAKTIVRHLNCDYVVRSPAQRFTDFCEEVGDDAHEQFKEITEQSITDFVPVDGKIVFLIEVGT